MIQTYNTSILYLLCSKPVLHSVYLAKEKKGDRWKWAKLLGQLAGALVLKKGIEFIRKEGARTYLGLILIWATPFLWVLWSLAYQFLLSLPLSSTLFPIVLPTVYLWVVDTLALQRGTWVIESGTKTGWTLWPGLEIEEAIFFLLTNALIVFGLVAFDNAVAVLNAFPSHFKTTPSLPSPILLVKALLLPAAAYDDDRVLAIKQSVSRLKRKSRSFYLASSVFQGRLRIDLTLLYSFCRIADDLIDNAGTAAEAKEWLVKLRKLVDLSYTGDVKREDGQVIPAKDRNQGQATLYAVNNFPGDAILTLMMLPTSRLGREPLDELLKGFEMDLAFNSANATGPIKSEADLDLYGARVAGTVALLCIQLVLFHYPGTSEVKAKRLMEAGNNMGIALQYTNIARDLSVDAVNGRCYVPLPWLKRDKLLPETFLVALTKAHNSGALDEFLVKKISDIRVRLLEKAYEFYDKGVDAIEELPREARAPMRVAVESYMQIARELEKPGLVLQGLGGRATVPKWKRITVAWRALLGPRAKR